MPGGTERFLGEVFRDLPEGARLLIWTLAHKRSSWYGDPAKAAHRAEIDGAVDDVYVGCAWRARNLGPHKRGAEADCAGITGLWADVDVEMAGHKRAAFKTKAAARKFLDELPIPPTAIVDSGNGLQAWWLLSEAWAFQSESDRVAAARLLAWWQAALRGWARQAGADLDPTADLPRILRVPGTTNRKSDPAKGVKLVYLKPEHRYSASDFEEYLVEPGNEALPEVGKLKLESTAEAPTAKLDALIENDEDFKRSWARTRTDFKDQSGSAYDLSLATKAAQAAWSEQEIADMLIASRRRHGDDLKLRQDYYAATIGKAMVTGAKSDVRRAAEEVVSIADGDDRETVLCKLCARLEIKIERIIKVDGDPPTYSFHFDNGRTADFKGAAYQGTAGQHRLARAVYEQTGREMAGPFKGREWKGVCEAITLATTELDAFSESRPLAVFEEWVERYLADTRATKIVEESDWKAAAVMYRPHTRGDGWLYLSTSGEGLVGWIRARGDRITAPEAGAHLTRLGWTEHESPSINLGGDERISRKFWKREL